jgi:hypothetical protein
VIVEVIITLQVISLEPGMHSPPRRASLSALPGGFFIIFEIKKAVTL